MPATFDQWLGVVVGIALGGIFLWVLYRLYDIITEKALMKFLFSNETFKWEREKKEGKTVVTHTEPAAPYRLTSTYDHFVPRLELRTEGFEEVMQQVDRRFQEAHARANEATRVILQVNEQMRQQMQQQFRVPEPEAQRIINSPNNCTHVWQTFQTQRGRVMEICGLCSTTRENNTTVLPSVPPCASHTWNNPIMMVKKNGEPYRHYVCSSCGRTKSEAVVQMTVAEARLKKVRSIFITED